VTNAKLLPRFYAQKGLQAFSSSTLACRHFGVQKTWMAGSSLVEPGHDAFKSVSALLRCSELTATNS
jgi:hypothetical protein